MTKEATQADFSLKLETKQFDFSSLKNELLVEQALSKWRFFPAPEGLVSEILLLSDKLVDKHLNQELEEELELDGEETNELADKDEGWFKTAFNEVSQILFHGSDKNQSVDFQDRTESISYYQSLISERIYNHLARLSRSAYAKQGGSFSIREELTEELAGKIGLGLYLRLDQNHELRQECNRVLFYLALSFQNWLLAREEFYVAPWGIICTPEKSQALLQNQALQHLLQGRPQLIMTPDVKEFVVTRMEAVVQAG
jgi:hypothetical protein